LVRHAKDSQLLWRVAMADNVLRLGADAVAPKCVLFRRFLFADSGTLQSGLPQAAGGWETMADTGDHAELTSTQEFGFPHQMAVKALNAVRNESLVRWSARF
jgi:hypothetical protein